MERRFHPHRQMLTATLLYSGFRIRIRECWLNPESYFQKTWIRIRLHPYDIHGIILYCFSTILIFKRKNTMNFIRQDPYLSFFLEVNSGSATLALLLPAVLIPGAAMKIRFMRGARSLMVQIYT